MNNLNIFDLHFCVKRLPYALKSLMQRHGSKIIVSGGYIRSIVSGEKVSDIDIFAGDKQQSEIFATELSGDKKFHTTDNAFTLRNLSLPVQFIFRWVFEKPSDIVDSFDFTICQAAVWYDLDSNKWNSFCSERFYQDVAAKRLVYLSPVRNEDAGGSLLRVLKYYQRGYRIPLDSFGAVIARLVVGVDMERISGDDTQRELQLSKVISGLLFEVDPNGFIDHQAYLPSKEQINQETDDEGREDE